MRRTKASEYLMHEGFVQGLREANSIITEMARKFDDDTNEWLEGKLQGGSLSRKFYEKHTFASVPFREEGKTWWHEVERPEKINKDFGYGYDAPRGNDDGGYKAANDAVGNEQFQQFLDSNLNGGNVRYGRILTLLKTGKDEFKSWSGTQQLIVYLMKGGEASLDWVPASLNSDDSILDFLQSKHGSRWGWYENNIDGIHLPTEQEKERLINAYQGVVDEITKRCQTYWKKFGNSKLNSWSYMRD